MCAGRKLWQNFDQTLMHNLSASQSINGGKIRNFMFCHVFEDYTNYNHPGQRVGFWDNRQMKNENNTWQH